MKLTQSPARPELDALLKRAVEAYNAMTPEEKAAHDYEQRRSFVRGMCPESEDLTKWSKIVDELLPPMAPPPGVPLAWVLGKLKKIANTGQSIESDHWKFRQMARETAAEIINRFERP